MFQTRWTRKKSIKAPRMGAQINDCRYKSLICKESENDTFHFPRSKKPILDFLRPCQTKMKGMEGMGKISAECKVQGAEKE